MTALVGDAEKDLFLLLAAGGLSHSLFGEREPPIGTLYAPVVYRGLDAQDGLASFEPAFADELSVIMAWAFDDLHHDGEGDPGDQIWLRDETGRSV